MFHIDVNSAFLSWTAAYRVNVLGEKEDLRQIPIIGLYNGLAFLHFGISIITIVVATVLFQNIKARQEEKLQNELLAIQVESTEKHIRQVESLYQDIRGIKHDMTNHILTLERLYAGNNVEEAMDNGSELKFALAPWQGR